MARSSAARVARKVAERSEPIEVTLSDGNKATLKPVPATVMVEALQSIPDPEPVYFEKEDGNRVENPTDPRYVRAVNEVSERRQSMVIDVMLMFGVDCIVPDSEGWLPKVRSFFDLTGRDLESEYSLDDEFDVAFLYKKYVVGDSSLFVKIREISGLQDSDLDEAEGRFQGN